MLKKTFTEEQIVLVLREAESGTPVTEVCRKMGVSEKSFSRWKRKYEGNGVAVFRRLRQFEEEKRKLKKLAAYVSLDKHILQEVLVNRLIQIPRPTAYYWSRKKTQDEIRIRFRGLASVRV